MDNLKAIEELSAAGIIKCDTVHLEDGKFRSAVIEFAGVKFGMNKGFLFITSRQDDEAIDSLTAKISQYYV